MNNKITKIITTLIAIALIVGVSILLIAKTSSNQNTTNIISSNFIGYDFARAVTGTNTNTNTNAGTNPTTTTTNANPTTTNPTPTNPQPAISMLLKPGTEAHDFEPTPEDIINLKNADLFIYVGGESDDWVTELLANNEIPQEKTLRLMDLVELKTEETSPGMETEESDTEKTSEAEQSSATTKTNEQQNNQSHNHHETEYDEHIWTSPINAIKLVNAIKDKLVTLHPENAPQYNQNAQAYISQLTDIDQSLRQLTTNSSQKELIFGDRFPFRYLVDEYGLSYYAAFPGCSEQTEASSKTVAFLIDQAKADHIKVILKIELTPDKLAQTIAAESGAKVMELNAAHNISQADFDRGQTYVDIMQNNLQVLKEALQ